MYNCDRREAAFMNEIVIREEQQKLESVIAYVNKEKDRLKGVEAEQRKKRQKN